MSKDRSPREPSLPMTSTQPRGSSWLEGSRSELTAKGWHHP